MHVCGLPDAQIYLDDPYRREPVGDPTPVVEVDDHVNFLGDVYVHSHDTLWLVSFEHRRCHYVSGFGEE